MAITSVDQVLAGMQPPRYLVKQLMAAAPPVAGRQHSWWGLPGIPGVGAYDNTANGVALSGNSVIGQIPRANPGSGNSYLARLGAFMPLSCTAYLLDRLWHNQLTINSTALQSITTPTVPARDVNGSSNGEGVFVGLEIVGGSGTNAPCTMTYTNSAGTGSRTATLVDGLAASVPIEGTFYRFGLASGDTGVRSIQSFQFSTAYTAGSVYAVAFRPITVIDNFLYIGGGVDAMQGPIQRIFDDSVLYLGSVQNGVAVNGILSATYIETQG